MRLLREERNILLLATCQALFWGSLMIGITMSGLVGQILAEHKALATLPAGILALTWFHHWLGRRRKDFVAGTVRRTGRRFRLMNEVPTLCLIVIVVAVIARPF